MIRSLFFRLLSALFVIFGVVTIVFFLIHIVPGDPVEVMLGESVSSADRTAIIRSIGLDQPLWL